jgi:hypothetical protein
LLRIKFRQLRLLHKFANVYKDTWGKMDAIFIKKKVLSTLKKIPQTKKCNMSYTQIRQCTLKNFLIRKIVVLNLQV